MTGIRKYSSRFAGVIVFAALLLAVPAVAQAAVLEYQVQYMPVGTGGVSQLIVNVVLTPETELPATVRVPLPAGANAVWSGEIIGEDPALDPYREATVTAVSGGQVVEFVMTESRIAQVEADYVVPARSGSDVSATLAWVNTGEEAPLLVSVRLEPGAGDVRISPTPAGDALSNDAGETLYGLESVTLATGAGIDIEVSYGLGGASTGDRYTAPLLIVGGLLVVAVIALVVVAARDRQRRAGASPTREVPVHADEDELTF